MKRGDPDQPTPPFRMMDTPHANGNQVHARTLPEKAMVRKVTCPRGHPIEVAWLEDKQTFAFVCDICNQVSIIAVTCHENPRLYWKLQIAATAKVAE
jgi:hypothetical protein